MTCHTYVYQLETTNICAKEHDFCVQLTYITGAISNFHTALRAAKYLPKLTVKSRTS